MPIGQNVEQKNTMYALEVGVDARRDVKNSLKRSIGIATSHGAASVLREEIDYRKDECNYGAPPAQRESRR